MKREFKRINLLSRNSFHVDQVAERLVEADGEADLRELFREGVPEKWMVLGGGNNILFTRDYDGLLVVPAARGIEITREEGDRTWVRAEAGLEWDDLVSWSVAHGLWGLENLSLIPGKVGAAPVQNIGAYGAEAQRGIESVECFFVDDLKMRTLRREECAFGYRESIFKHELRGKCIILAVTFVLSRTPRPDLDYGDLARETEARGGATLENIREAVCAIRRSKLPDTAVLGNAGSFFKNPTVDLATAGRLRAEWPDMPLYPSPSSTSTSTSPSAGGAGGAGRVKLAAGWLIDRCGMKGFREGNVGVHDRQALVLVNHGGATGGEVLALARKVQQRVRERFGVEIVPEVNII